MRISLLYCDYEEHGRGTPPYNVMDYDIECQNVAEFVIYQELRPEDIGEENPYDMLNAGTVLACHEHKDLMVQEILADGIGSDVGLFVITIIGVEQVR